jgi:single-strand DNA-binding protein
MSNLNKVMLIGQLGSDPEKKVTDAGTSVANLSIATTSKWKDDSGVSHEKTEWHRIVCWKGLADLAEKYLKKGSKVYVEGRLQTREWEDKDDQKRYTTEIVCRELKFMDSKNSSKN